MVYRQLMKLFPNIREEQAKRLSLILEKVATLILDEMHKITSNEMTELHINLKEEMIFEHAKLHLHIVNKVIEVQTKDFNPNDINIHDEENKCFSPDGFSKIRNTAKIIAEHIWLPKYHQRWKLKTRAALAKENKQKTTKLTIKKVRDNHFIPKSFIQKYWANAGNIRKNIINPTEINSKIISFSKWGFVRNLYSDWLEAYFGLIEGDASEPIRKIINCEPLNGPEKNALIGFIVIQHIRNPSFIEKYTQKLRPLVIEHYGLDKANELTHQRMIYESLYSNNDAYGNLAKSLHENQWVLIRSPNNKILLPDICNIFSSISAGTFIVAPITYKDCLFVLPGKSDGYPFSRYITATDELEHMLMNFIVSNCQSEFLSSLDTEIDLKNISMIDIEKLVDLVSQLSHRDY